MNSAQPPLSLQHLRLWRVLCRAVPPIWRLGVFSADMVLAKTAKDAVHAPRSSRKGNMRKWTTRVRTATTARGFEPLRAEPNGFLVHHLSHSVTLSRPLLTQHVTEGCTTPTATTTCGRVRDVNFSCGRFTHGGVRLIPYGTHVPGELCLQRCNGVRPPSVFFWISCRTRCIVIQLWIDG